ncbi:MAG: hypothetical protein ABI896_10460 [Actinomycetota bacterium]
MSARFATALLAALVLASPPAAAAAGRSSSELALGTKAVVTHTQIASGDQKAATTTLGITVLKVRKGTQEELTQGGLTVDAKNKSDTPYYVDVRNENQGSAAIKRSLDVSLEDQDGNLINAVLIFQLRRQAIRQMPGDQGRRGGARIQLRELHALPRPRGQRSRAGSASSHTPPGKETEFVYWKAA